jgi:Protein of unknown function (DUF1552)
MRPILRQPMARRTFLRAGAVQLALPMLDVMRPRVLGGDGATAPRRLVCVCTVLGWHAPLFFPAETGRAYLPPPYLALLDDFRDDYTIFSGFAHPGNETAGHQSECTFLTGGANPQAPGFRNSISLDQEVAERIGRRTRFPSLQFASATSRIQSLAFDGRGVNLPSDARPSKVFARLFLEGEPDELRRETARLAEGRSILDAVAEQARRLGRDVGAGDREKLDEYLTSVRDAERRLEAMQAWAKTPKPHVDAPPPSDVSNAADHIAKIQAMFALIPLALQTDSTRVVTMLIGYNDMPMPLPGVTMDHHHLSHHGQVPEKLAQLRTVEEAEMRTFAAFLAKMRAAKEGGAPLLDNTAVLLGSNLGNANSHSTRNLPILLAGGGFKHGQHLAAVPAGKPDQPAPLGKLFVSILQRMGFEADNFGGASGTVAGLEAG